MAEMSVHQTRAHFSRTLGEIVDRSEVGQQLTEVHTRLRWKYQIEVEPSVINLRVAMSCDHHVCPCALGC